MLDDRSRGEVHQTPEQAERSPLPARFDRGEAVMSTREAAAVLGISEQSVRRAIARGDLAAVKRGRAYAINREDLARFSRRRGAPATAAPPRIVALSSRTTIPLLPAPASRFVGRETELAALVALLADPDARLITLTGPGGIGKTRLALVAAEALPDGFPDGARFIDLSAVTRPHLFVPTLAQQLGLRDHAAQEQRARLTAYLNAKRFLLILDNFEQILDAAPDVARILAESPGVKILVTSRASLRIGGEREVPLPPMSLAEGDVDRDALLASDAGRLFVERAQWQVPGFSVDDESAPVIAEICARLDGLPLAIELAAARCKVLPPRYLLNRLERRLPLLTLGARDAPARLRTMRDAIGWSFDHLTLAEQRLFRRLAICAGGCTLEAAAAIFRADDPGHEDDDVPDELLDLLGALVEKSLLVRELEPEGEPRFRMLETIREYGLEQLDPAEEEAARTAHARHFLSLAQSLRRWTVTRSTSAPIVRLAADEANLRAAHDWLAERGPAADFAAIAAACYVFWYMLGWVRDAVAWIERALVHQEAASAADRAWLLIGRAELLVTRGEIERAKADFAEGVPRVRAVGDPVDLALALIAHGAWLCFAGKYTEGEALLAEALAVAETIDDPALRAAMTGRALANLGAAARGRGDLALAAARLEEAMRRYHGLGLDLAEARALSDLAGIAADQGNHRLAVQRYLASIELTGERGEVRVIPDALAGIASAAAAWGLDRLALLLFGAAAALHDRMGMTTIFPTDVARSSRDLAALHEARGEQAAVAILEEGRALSVAEAIAIATAIAPPPDGPSIVTVGAPALLTRRERDVLQLLAEARTDREIAEALFLSPRTVSWHVRGILAKLGAASRREAVARARAEELISP
jgi:non-specific serine/threonine protein kinase